MVIDGGLDNLEYDSQGVAIIGEVVITIITVWAAIDEIGMKKHHRLSEQMHCICFQCF